MGFLLLDNVPPQHHNHTGNVVRDDGEEGSFSGHFLCALNTDEPQVPHIYIR